MAKNSATRSFDRGFDDVWQSAHTALEEAGASIAQADQASGRIEARVSMSLMSWGEVIEVAVSKGASPPTNVTIESRSRFPLTLVDWGKNARNVRTVLHHMESAASSSARDA